MELLGKIFFKKKTHTVLPDYGFVPTTVSSVPRDLVVRKIIQNFHPDYEAFVITRLVPVENTRSLYMDALAPGLDVVRQFLLLFLGERGTNFDDGV